MSTGTVYFISGHIDITEEEFNTHYRNRIDLALQNPFSTFVIGDAQGADTLAKNYLGSRIDKTRITIYTRRSPIQCSELVGFKIKGSFKNHTQKDAAMTRDSDEDILYIRPADIQKQLLEARGIKYDPNRLSGTEQNLNRRFRIRSGGNRRE